MQKIFKNSKQILAFVMAFAIIAVSLVTGGAAVTADACDTTKVDYWDGTLATSLSGKGTEEEPYIITTAEELAFICLGQETSTSTSGKYYKVDDSVKTFVMQPESVVTLDELLALDSPEAVNNYFAALDGKVNWISMFKGQSFNGQFDGNGATVYGLYADGEAAGKDDVGLFPQYDGGTVVNSRRVFNTCKNIAVKNSYFHTRRRLGAIAGACYGTNFGAKIDGQLTVDSCAVENCYMTGIGTWNYYQEQGVVVGGGNGDVIELKNVLVKDVYAFNTEQKANINVIGNGSTVRVANKYANMISDSIILGTAPYGIDYYSTTVHEPSSYTNVVTDFPTGKVELATPNWDSKTTTKDYTDRIFSVTEEGFAFKAAASMLDWDNVWFMSENGPELRVFHGKITLTTTHTTHIWECEDCGLLSPDGEDEHEFALVGDTVLGDGFDVYECTICKYVCQHNEQTEQTYDPGDCVTASGFYSRCKYCDWFVLTKDQDAPGHTFTHEAADPGHCEQEGHKEYWYCEVCKNKFATEDVMAAMNTAVTDEWLNTGLGGHIKDEDADGVIVMYDKNGHWYICSVNGGRLDADSNAIAEDEVIEHDFEADKCQDCDYVCTEHKLKITGLETKGGCDTDEISKIQCELCEFKGTTVTRNAGHTIEKVEELQPDDRIEGYKAHYKCTVCKEIFADKEGKTKITQTSIIIPKVLPEEYHNMIKADGGNKSPSTGDNLASVISMVALAGAMLLITKKK